MKVKTHFDAINFSSYEEDGLVVLAFAEGMDPEPEKYVIFTRLADESEYYIEYSNEGDFQGYDGLSKAVLHENVVDFIFEDNEDPPIGQISIGLKKICEKEGWGQQAVLDGLVAIFSLTDVKIQS